MIGGRDYAGRTPHNQQLLPAYTRTREKTSLNQVEIWPHVMCSNRQQQLIVY